MNPSSQYKNNEMHEKHNFSNSKTHTNNENKKPLNINKYLDSVVNKLKIKISSNENFNNNIEKAKIHYLTTENNHTFNNNKYNNNINNEKNNQFTNNSINEDSYENNLNSRREFLKKIENHCSSKNCGNKFKMNKMQKFIIELSDEIESLKFVNFSLIKSLKLKEEYIFSILKQNNFSFTKGDKFHQVSNLNNSNIMQTKRQSLSRQNETKRFQTSRNNFSLSSSVIETSNNLYSNKNLNVSDFNSNVRKFSSVNDNNTNAVKQSNNDWNFNNINLPDKNINFENYRKNNTQRIYYPKAPIAKMNLNDNYNNALNKQGNLSELNNTNYDSIYNNNSNNNFDCNPINHYTNLSTNNALNDLNNNKANLNLNHEKKRRESKMKSNNSILPIVNTNEKNLDEKTKKAKNIEKNDGKNNITNASDAMTQNKINDENNENFSFNKTGFIYQLVNYALERGESHKKVNDLFDKENLEKKEENVLQIQNKNTNNQCEKVEINKNFLIENKDSLINDTNKIKNETKAAEINSNNKSNKECYENSIIKRKKNDEENNSTSNEKPKIQKGFKPLRFLKSLKSGNSKKSFLSNEALNESGALLQPAINTIKNFEVIQEKDENKFINEKQRYSLKDREIDENFNDNVDSKRNSNSNQKELSAVINLTEQQKLLNSRSPSKSKAKKAPVSRAQSFNVNIFTNNLKASLSPSRTKSITYNNNKTILNSLIPNSQNSSANLGKSNQKLSFQNLQNLQNQNTNNALNNNPSTSQLQNINLSINPNSTVININGTLYAKLTSNLASLINQNQTANTNTQTSANSASKYISNQNSHYNKILGLFNRIEKSSKTSNNRVSFLGHSDNVLKRMVKSDLINEISKLTNSDEEFVICMRAFKDEKLLMFCDLISALIKDYQYSIQLIRKIKTFLTISVKLVTSTNSSEALEMIVCNSNEVLCCESSVIYVYDKYSKKLISQKTQSAEALKITPGEGVVGWVFQNNQKQKIDDALNDNRFFSESAEGALPSKKAAPRKVRTILVAPLRDEDGNAYGVIEAVNKKNGFFTNDDEELIDIFAKQVSSILSNSLQYDEYNTHVTRLHSLLDFSLKLPLAASEDKDKEFAWFVKCCEEWLMRLWGINEARMFLVERKNNFDDEKKDATMKEELVRCFGADFRNVYKPIGLVGKCLFKREIIAVMNIYENQDYNSLIDIEGCFCLVTFPVLDYEMSRNIELVMQLEFNSNLLHFGRLRKNHLDIFNKFSQLVSFWFSKIKKNI